MSLGLKGFAAISHDTMFFSHSKTASVGLSAPETISRTACKLVSK